MAFLVALTLGICIATVLLVFHYEKDHALDPSEGRHSNNGLSISGNASVFGATVGSVHGFSQIIVNQPPPTNVRDLPSLITNLAARGGSFCGREAELSEASEYFDDSNCEPIVYWGAGGVGKTDFALEYAHRNVSRYRIVWWIPASNTSGIHAAFLDLGRRLGLPVDAYSQRATSVVRTRLAELGDTLLVFDDAPSFASIHEYIPAMNVDVVVTTRDGTSSARPDAREFGLLTNADAVLLLSKHVPEIDPVAASDLANALGLLPLALVQAGSFMKLYGIKPVSYLERYEQIRAKIFDQGQVSPGGLERITTTWTIHYERLQEECPGAVNLLNLVSFLDPDSIDLHFLCETINTSATMSKALRSVVGEPTSPGGSALSGLLATSMLVRSMNNSYRIHRLIQDVTRGRLSKYELWETCEAVVEMLTAAMPAHTDDPKNWVQAQKVAPHVLNLASLLKFVNPRRALRRDTAHIMDKAAIYLAEQGSILAAQKLMMQAVDLLEVRNRRDHRDADLLRRTRVNLGTVLHNLGEYRAGLEIANEGMRLGKACPDLEIAAHNNLLGNLHYGLGHDQLALRHYQLAIEADQAMFGRGHSGLIPTLVNVGNLHFRGGRPLGAERAYREALRVETGAANDDSVSISGATEGLARILAAKGELKKSLTTMEQILSQTRENLGETHPEVGRVMAYIGDIECHYGDIHRAKKHYRNALAILKSGPDGLRHPYSVAVKACLDEIE